MAYINVRGELRHVPKFGGEMWFVSKANGSDSNLGTTPDGAFETIGAAITACAAGDAINIMAGTYTETGLDLDENNVELWSEIGVIIDPATGTGLTISANYCKITGSMVITPSAGNTGLLLSGSYGYFEGITASAGDINFEITGMGNTLKYCIGSVGSATGFDIQANSQLLVDCSTAGIGTSTTGFKISNSADYCILRGCTSIGNGTAGFSIATGSASCTLKDCSSGAGDGRWVDADNVNVWSNFTFDNFLHKEFTLDSGGAATFTEDLFVVTGIVQIDYIYAEVETAISADVDVVYLDLFPTGGAAIEITDNAGAVFDDLKAGSLISKQGVATEVLTVEDSNLGFVSEYAGNFKNSLKPFVVGKKNGAVTNIRMVYDTGGSASGQVCWMVKWLPISDDGFLALA